MNTTKWIAIAIAALLMGVAIGYYVLCPGRTSVPDYAATTTVPVAAAPAATTNSPQAGVTTNMPAPPAGVGTNQQVQVQVFLDGKDLAAGQTAADGEAKSRSARAWQQMGVR